MHPRKKINKEEAGLTRTEECAAMLLPSEATTRTSAGDARSAEKSAHGAIASLKIFAAGRSLRRCSWDDTAKFKNTVI